MKTPEQIINIYRDAIYKALDAESIDEIYDILTHALTDSPDYNQIPEKNKTDDSEKTDDHELQARMETEERLFRSWLKNFIKYRPGSALFEEHYLVFQIILTKDIRGELSSYDNAFDEIIDNLERRGFLTDKSVIRNILIHELWDESVDNEWRQ